MGYGETPNEAVNGPFVADPGIVPAGPYHATNSIAYVRAVCQAGVPVDAEFWVPFLKAHKVA